MTSPQNQQMFENDPFGKVKDEKQNLSPPARVVNKFHEKSDVDLSPNSQHHSLGLQRNQSAIGSHTHNGKDSRKIMADAPITITGSRGGNAAVASIIAALSQFANIIDSTTP